MNDTPAPGTPFGRFARLRELIARRRSATTSISLDVSDADRVRALGVLISKIKSGNLTPDDEQRARALEAFVVRVASTKVATASPGV
jgi:hypothetical protein